MEKSFHEIEHQAWSERAEYYDRLFSSISSQAIAPILDSLGELEGQRHLDVACGTGHLVTAAGRRGAISEGIDFARSMVDAAVASYPKSRFRVGDARNLPHPTASMDAVTCAFGLPHMENPQQAINEAFRVLKPGGRFAFTLWFGADHRDGYQSIINCALETFATTPFNLPEEWIQMRSADQSTCKAVTRQAGFNAPIFKELSIGWQTTSAEAVIELFEKMSLRTKLVFDHQPSAVQKRIREFVLTEAEARRKNGVITLVWSALLTVVQKPV